MPRRYVGLDVGDLTTAVCVVDDQGETVLEATVATTPDSVAEILVPLRRSLKAIGLESGAKASWLHKELRARKLPVICLDARHAHAALSARPNKSDVSDARGLALLLARGIYTLAYIKEDEASHIQTVVKLRETLLRKGLALESAIKMTQKKFGPPKKGRRRQMQNDSSLVAVEKVLDSLRRSSDAIALECRDLDVVIHGLARDNDVCHRLMTIPGVGPITALTFLSAVDNPKRFRSSRVVAAYFGLTPKLYQSGAVLRHGRISLAGDASTRKALCTSARSLLISSRSGCSLRRWGLQIANTKGYKVAYVAVARKLAVLMHHLWISGEDFDGSR